MGIDPWVHTVEAAEKLRRRLKAGCCVLVFGAVLKEGLRVQRTDRWLLLGPPQPRGSRCAGEAAAPAHCHEADWVL